ncbi:hypothetical protein ACMGE7_01190 [Macrococcus equi]|uniref:hypothetical protein n=1 Tax=Macrococcus equi TaxID=3395462 RepID=UPI0039BEBC5D
MTIDDLHNVKATDNHENYLGKGIQHATERYGSADEKDPSTLTDDPGNQPGTVGKHESPLNPEAGVRENALAKADKYVEERFTAPKENDPAYQAKHSDPL